MFTSQKIGRTVFVSLYFDKIFYYANALDGMYVNAHKKWPSHKFLVCTSLLFNKNNPQVAARATRLQWLKIEQKHRMTSSTWLWGCRTKWVIGHRTWSIIGHSTILYVSHDCVGGSSLACARTWERTAPNNGHHVIRSSNQREAFLIAPATTAMPISP